MPWPLGDRKRGRVRQTVIGADDEGIVLLGDDLRLLEPGVVLRTRESHLQLAEGGGPQLLEVQWFPFSLLVHYRSPHARDAARIRGSPHRRERPLETALSWKPANYTPGKMTSRCAMLTYTNRHPLISVIALFQAGDGTRP